jgi:SAM-dependent methyltransferase
MYRSSYRSPFAAKLWSAVAAEPDKSNGYEEISPVFLAGRGSGKGVGIGTSVVAKWAAALPRGATVLDLGCGAGVPMTRIFIERGFKVYGVDAAPAMIAAFKARFPGVPVECAAAEESDFFGRTFDAVVSWGLFFLLEEEIQRKLIAKVAGALRSGGRLLFTATRQSCTWHDALTGRISISLGHEAYQRELEAQGLTLVGTETDEGENFYFFAEKT